MITPTTALQHHHNRRPAALVLTLAALTVGCAQSSPESDRPAPAQPESAAPQPLEPITQAPDETSQAPQAAPLPGPWFEECAVSRGLNFTHHSGHDGETFLFPEIVTGGAAIFDFDSDGLMDIYCVQAGDLRDAPADRPPNQLFRNTGNGNFIDITQGSGADDHGYGMGAAVGDFDNDGKPDLYITNVGPNVLLHNNGDGTFSDVTSRAGVGHTGWGTSAAFLDYDNDGDLDLFVTNYVNWSLDTERECLAPTGERDYCEPNSYQSPAIDVLFQNNGDGTFSDVTSRAAIDQAFGNGLGVVCGDFNSDGFTDIYVANDGMQNQLWINQGDGTFRNDALIAGCALDLDGTAKAGMGTCAEDIDDDGDLDLLVVNLTNETDSFYRNEGSYFVDHTARIGLAGLSRAFTRFGVALVDFNNDSMFDLFTANGRVRRVEQRDADDIFAEPNLLFRGESTGRFAEQTPRGGTDPILIATSRAAAFGDIDNDGRIDILVINRDRQLHLLRNIAPDAGHWIKLNVLDDHGRDAYGARVTMNVGSRTVTREVRSAFSYLAANDPRVHIGLGLGAEVYNVTVHWVDGTTEHFGDFDANQIITLHRGAGRVE